MHRPTHTPGRMIWIACAALLLLPRLAAAVESSLAPDLDGDGRRDQVTLVRGQPSVLHVWLSASDSIQSIHARAPLVRVVAIDLDGDRRPELIASDSGSGIHVWTRRRRQFRSFHPRSVVPGVLGQPGHHRVEPGSDESNGVITSAPYVLDSCSSPHAPSVEASNACTVDSTRASRARPSSDPSAPRPPPATVTR